MTLRRAALVGVLGAVLAACSGATAPASSDQATDSGDFTIFAASSLKGVLDQVKVAYESAVPGTRLTIATGSSASLETQIEQGAPADIFLAADTANPQKLVDAGLAAGDPVPFAGNALAIIAPLDGAVRLASPVDLARPGIRVIAAGDQVPITAYAAQLTQALAELPGYPADFVGAYVANIVSREEDSRAVLGKIELGEGDAGIVYLTDALASDEVTTIPAPATTNVAATYAGVVIRGSSNEVGARAFLDWLVGPDGQAILRASGFVSPT